jgi:hypothetical protein
VNLFHQSPAQTGLTARIQRAEADDSGRCFPVSTRGGASDETDERNADAEEFAQLTDPSRRELLVYAYLRDLLVMWLVRSRFRLLLPEALPTTTPHALTL